MSDELRSAPGPRHDQRRNRGAPAWWAELERVDLPEDDRSPGSRRPQTSRPSPRRPGPGGRPGNRIVLLPVVAICALVVVVAVVLGFLGVGGSSLRSVAMVLLVFGLLAVITATVIVRRAG